MNDYERDLYVGPLPAGSGEPPAMRLAWLAGFTDGEGTISLSVNTHEKGKKTITPRFSLSNTNLANLGRARVLLAQLVGHDVTIRSRRDDGERRPAYSLELASHFDVDVTIRALYPYLIGKWQQAYVVLEYLTIAPGHPSHADGFSRARGKRPTAGGRYDERHWELVKTLRRLNRRYARGEWQTRDAASKEAEKPDTPPGHQPMDPLKRWYKLYVG